jgi:diguanylate cyclase (GGDEF)-like protein
LAGESLTPGDPRPRDDIRVRRALPAYAVAVIGLLGILAVGAIDYVTGVELRLGPVYYVPLSLVAWELGSGLVVTAALLCAISVTASNYLAGQSFSTFVTVFNFTMQWLSFMVIGLLITALRRALAHERALSRTDGLTSLLTARTFYEEAVRVLAFTHRTGHPVALAYVDLDMFKVVNDTSGHRAGDEVLRAVGGIILGCTRKSDLAARLGGDEFALLMPETDPHHARRACERLRTLIEERFKADPCPVTATVGGVAFLTAPDNVDAMVHLADARMYAAKAAGRNRVDVEVMDPVEAAART